MNNSISFPTNNLDYVNSSANNLFERASRPNWRSLLPARFRAADQALPILTHESTDNVDKAETTTRRVVLSQVCGSVSSARGEDFDTNFRPVRKHLKDRWVRVAQACFQQKVLPPVNLVQIADNYYVVDGHHRVSVAKSLGHDEILANVTCC